MYSPASCASNRRSPNTSATAPPSGSASASWIAFWRRVSRDMEWVSSGLRGGGGAFLFVGYHVVDDARDDQQGEVARGGGGARAEVGVDRGGGDDDHRTHGYRLPIKDGGVCRHDGAREDVVFLRHARQGIPRRPGVGLPGRAVRAAACDRGGGPIQVDHAPSDEH